MVGSISERSEQLVIEFMVRDLRASVELYTTLGFIFERRDGSFAALRWEDRRLFLDERSELPPHDGPPRANVRIIVPDVDAVWGRAQELGVRIHQAIGDRHYGLRDFTVVDPDGFGLRFASVLPPRPR